jgi:hypothetical protein
MTRSWPAAPFTLWAPGHPPIITTGSMTSMVDMDMNMPSMDMNMVMNMDMPNMDMSMVDMNIPRVDTNRDTSMDKKVDMKTAGMNMNKGKRRTLP